MTLPAELAQRLRAPLVRYARGFLGSPEEAEDAVQDVLARALAAAEAAADPRAWLYRCLRNHCLNLRRARERRPEELASAFDPPAEATRLLSRLAQAEEHAALGERLARLPAGEREALVLRYVEDLSREEIARVLDVPLATVKTWLFAGLERLRALSDRGRADA
jgi:RNA polymerase sigma-70 factor (ECF subfamily)